MPFPLSVHTLLQACDLLPELVYLVFEILLTPTDAGITGFHNGPETIHGLDNGPAQKTCGDVQPANRCSAGWTSPRVSWAGPWSRPWMVSGLFWNPVIPAFVGVRSISNTR